MLGCKHPLRPVELCGTIGRTPVHVHPHTDGEKWRSTEFLTHFDIISKMQMQN